MRFVGKAFAQPQRMVLCAAVAVDDAAEKLTEEELFFNYDTHCRHKGEMHYEERRPATS